MSYFFTLFVTRMSANYRSNSLTAENIRGLCEEDYNITIDYP